MIPMPSQHGDMIYNFWQDKSHPSGIWRRTTMASYRTPAPQWETVIDVGGDVLPGVETPGWWIWPFGGLAAHDEGSRL